MITDIVESGGRGWDMFMSWEGGGQRWKKCEIKVDMGGGVWE